MISPTLFWKRPDVLAAFADRIDMNAIGALRAERLPLLDRPHWTKLRSALAELPLGSSVSERGVPLSIALDQPAVQIGLPDQLSEQEQTVLQEVIRLLVPWRKGPFDLFGNYIDAEWRSDFKWSRIKPGLDPLAGKRICDVGCSNGYYLLRAQAEAPELLLGLDPSEQFFYAFEFFQRFLQLPTLQYELMGIEHLDSFADFFDVVLCCGVLYHQRNPLDALRKVLHALVPGGQALIETQAIPGTGGMALFPEDRYAKARNVFFIPTADCLIAWMKRVGFNEIVLVSSETVTVEEQRRTELAPYESLIDFLDPSDLSKTVEGYPAPLRVAVSGRRKK